MNKTAWQSEFPHEIWLGKIDGEWPITTFTTENAAMTWAAKTDGNKRYRVVGPIDIDAKLPTRTATTIPAQVLWEEE